MEESQHIQEIGADKAMEVALNLIDNQARCEQMVSLQLSPPIAA